MLERVYMRQSGPECRGVKQRWRARWRAEVFPSANMSPLLGTLLRVGILQWASRWRNQR